MSTTCRHRSEIQCAAIFKGCYNSGCASLCNAMRLLSAYLGKLCVYPSQRDCGPALDLPSASVHTEYRLAYGFLHDQLENQPPHPCAPPRPTAPRVNVLPVHRNSSRRNFRPKVSIHAFVR